MFRTVGSKLSERLRTRGSKHSECLERAVGNVSAYVLEVGVLTIRNVWARWFQTFRMFRIGASKQFVFV